jgi:hypothetical protein
MSMKNKLRKNISLLMIGLFLACALTTLVEMQFKVLRRGYDQFVLDNRNHYLSCQGLPPKIKVERIVEQHQDVIQQIGQVAPGFVGVEIDSLTCEGKADLLIWYGTHQQRVAIEEIIADDTFFGIPYRLQNR